MIPATWTDEENRAFWRGFNLAQPPGYQEIDAIKRANEVAMADPGRLRVAVSKSLARVVLAEIAPLPENLSSATWIGFLRGTVAKASGELVHVHDAGNA